LSCANTTTFVSDYLSHLTYFCKRCYNTIRFVL